MATLRRNTMSRKDNAMYRSLSAAVLESFDAAVEEASEMINEIATTDYPDADIDTEVLARHIYNQLKQDLERWSEGLAEAATYMRD